ncbi:MAG TPA: dTDP-4-dehydrorhamnose reductase [Casimicrobiaceae bacterium]|nr:dTDP-4-dehydrorhamnose reductase [Casimicrobiaceae bacterium]
MARPTILVTGAQGQLGFELARLLPAHGEVTAVDRAQLELGDPDAIRSLLRALRPQLIVNAAAYTAVDQAEDEPEAAEAINARAPGVIAEEAKRLGALLVHYSTDYVFDGTASVPYPENATPNPVNAYGRSKWLGEQAVLASGAASLVLRTSWVYGLRGRNFLLTIRRLAVQNHELRIVADQFGVPNWSRAVAQATSALVALGLDSLVERAGIYHLSARGSTSWFGFAQAIVGPVDKPRVVPIKTSEYPTPARRPAYAVLATKKLEQVFGLSLEHWREALSQCLASENPG